MATLEHEHRVAGGFKATLKNKNASEEAKQHAREQLDSMGVSYEDEAEAPTKGSSYQTQSTTAEDSLGGKDRSHVIAGLRGTLKNKSVSEEAREHARQRLEELGVDVEAGSPVTGTTDLPEPEVEKTKAELEHEHRVIGGLKASIHNPNVSEEKKEENRNKLADMGVETELV